MFFGLVPTAYAQAEVNESPCGAGTGGIDLGNCLRLSDSTKVSDVYDTPAFLVNLFVSNIFVIAGIVFFLIVIVAGFKFIMGGQKGAEDAKGIFQAALTGFIIMFAAYWIIQIVALLTGIQIPGVSE
ncbi:MAG: hypothetical protein BroJett025_10920 [Patescibacteria group bacterium]|nr:MAG: hypothetical protein BroJett025_10920 [Patescibacteria group bacterium]